MASPGIGLRRPTPSGCLARLVEIRVHRWIVVHLHLPENPQWPLGTEDLAEQSVERLNEVIPLGVEHLHPGRSLGPVLRRSVSSLRLLPHVVAAKFKNREPVDRRAGRLGGSRGPGRSDDSPGR